MHKFHNILIPVLAIVFVTFGSFFFMLQYMAKDADTAMLKSEAGVLRAQLKQTANFITIMAEDYAVWTPAYENVFLNPNIEWLEENYGDNLNTLSNLDGLFIFGLDNKVTYYIAEEGQPPAEKFLESGLGDHLKTLTVDDLSTTVTSSGILETDNRIYLYGASLVQKHDNEESKKIPAERRPVVVYLQELSSENLLTIGNNIDMTNLHLHLYETEPSDFLMLDETVADNLFIQNRNVMFDWEAKNASSHLISRITLPLSIATAFIILAFFYFYRRAEHIFNMLSGLDKMKSNFVASMSHEMRTPLNAIIGFAELLKSESFGKVEGVKNKEYIGYILESGGHLLQVINDILDLSKVEAGKMDVHEDIYNVRDLIDDSLAILQPRVNKHGLTVQADIEEIEIKTDAKLFKQIVENILSNAIKYTPSGGQIKISNLFKRDYVEISITDTGIGMTEDEIEVALSTFGQVESAYTREHEGTGLGLSLVKKFMQLLGGKIYVTSQKHIGTTVSLNFPAATA